MSAPAIFRGAFGARDIVRGAAAARVILGCAIVAAIVVTAVPAHAQWRFSASGVASQIEHRVDAGFGVAQSSGMLYGGHGAVGIGQWVEVGTMIASGTLAADSASAEDLETTRGELWLAVHALPWLSMKAGAEAHTFTTPIASQRWTTIRIGAEARAPMLDGRFLAIGRFDLIPVANVDGAADVNRALAAGAGIAWDGGLLQAEIAYSLERYDFAEVSGVARREQLGIITARFGLRVGRSRGAAPAAAAPGR